MWLWLQQVLLHGLDWSDLPRTKVWAGGKIITLLHRSTWLCRVIAILGSLTTTERCFIEGTRDQPLGGADQGNPPPPAIAKPQYYIMSGTISTAFLPGGYKSNIFSYKQNLQKVKQFDSICRSLLMICEHGREIFWKKAIIKSSRPKRANKAKWERWEMCFGPGTLMKTGVVWDRWWNLAFEYWTVTLWGQTVSNWNTKTELISQDLRFVGNLIIYFKHPSMAKRGKVAP